jgi:hypothetical protein
MLGLAKALSMASTKIMLTFIVAIFLIILAILFYPTAYLALDDFANWLANLEAIRNPSDNKQSNAVVRVLVSETTIFGVVTTLVARMIVEVFFVLFGGLWRLVNPTETPAGSE